ncbi:MAG: hypothetical protein ACTSQQ_05095, partial [Candidatus Helarchaeota archaeon]
IDDFGAGDYRVFDNTSGDLTTSGWQSWVNNTSVDYPINTSNMGVFEYIIQFKDSIGQWGTSPDAVLITIIDDLPPSSNQPGNLTIGVNDTANIAWILTDNEGAGFYQVLVNNTPGDWNPWINNTALNYSVNTTVGGMWNYTIRYNDSIGQYGVPSTVFVLVIADYPPYSNHPANVTTYRNGTEVIDWILYDDVGGSNYSVLINSSPSSWYSWTNATNLQYPIDRTTPGIYNYTIIYNDTINKWGQPNTVFVTIIDSAPSSNHLNNITTGRLGTETIGWILIDDYGSSYFRVLMNSSSSGWIPWVNSTSLEYPINRTVPGVYVYTIEYNDSAGQMGVPSTVWVTVQDNPPTSNNPQNIATSKDSIVTIPWVLTDDYGTGFYRVLVNSSPDPWYPWINNTVIDYPVDTSITIVRNYTIQFNDSAGQWGNPHTVLVVISEYREPLATSEVEVNLTGILDGTDLGDENGFSMQIYGCNSTSINVTVSNVTLNNYYFPIEETGTENAQIDSETWVMAFNVTDSCQLSAVDFMYTAPILPFEEVPWTGVAIYNATYNATHFAIEPDQIIFWENESGLPISWVNRWVSFNTGGYWDGTFSTKPTLDISNTYQKIFFISFSTSNQTLNWRYTPDSNNGDQAKVYEWGGTDWESRPGDLTLRLTLSPLASEMEPYRINMTINSELVSNMGDWSSNEFRIPDISGFISMNVSTTWYSIGYTVNWTSTIQNITTAMSSVFYNSVNNTMEWDIVSPVVFVPSSHNNSINVTIPVTWNISIVYKDISAYFDWVEIEGNSRKSVVIRNAVDGLWTIICYGYNWITDITVSKDPIYTHDIISILGHLRDVVQDQVDTALLNLTDRFNTTLATYVGRGDGTLINITIDLSQTIYTNMEVILTLKWCNGTEAGVWNTSIKVYNTTSLTIAYPHHVFNIIERSRGSLFNLILYYNMSQWTGSWDTRYLDNTMGATVTYKYMGQSPLPMSVMDWEGHSAWSVQLTAPSTVGDYAVYINTTAWGGVQNYTNYLIIIRVAQYESKLVFNDTARESFWNTSISFTFRYTNITNYPIIAENISINWKFSTDLVWQGILNEGMNYTVSYNGGTGDYTIIFANFTAHRFTLLFTIDGESYQPQEEYLTLIFLNRTTTLTNQTVVPRILYQETGSITLTLYYNDVVNDVGIESGIIFSNWSIIKGYSIQSVGLGYYNITLDVSGVILGNYTILINASKQNYEVASLTVHLEIYGFPSNIVNLIGTNLTNYYTEIYAMESWAITFEYLNTSTSTGISNATISAAFGGYACIWQDLGNGNYTVWANSTIFSSPMARQNYTLEIIISRLFYECQTFTITINIIELPSIVTPLQTIIQAEVGDYIQIQIQFNDTHNLKGISGIVWYQIQGDIIQMVPGGIEGQYYAILNLTNFIPNVYLIEILAWATDYQNASTSITLNVELVNYSLTIRVPSHINSGQNLTIQADLFNGTDYVRYSMINFTITVVLQNNTIQVVYVCSLTGSNGTAFAFFLVPRKAISLYIEATYQRDGRGVVSSDTEIVTTVDPFLFFLESSFFWIIILLVMGYVVILGVYIYRKKLRPKFMSIESKKHELMKRRAENRREIATITQEIMQYRAQTLKDAELAKKNMEYGKAAKLYEKAGNLTLELADKSVAREFFLKAKEMQRLADDKDRERDLREQREKFLEKARVAIRERDVIEASRNYREVAEISRRLGEREQAAKFLKLANAANERIEALREGDLRKRSGVYLSKADKAMGKQAYLEAAKNFEEAAKIMVTLGEDDGVERFAGWAKLARERDALANEKSREEWIKDLNDDLKMLVAKARILLREKKFQQAIDVYRTLVVYAIELGNTERIEKYKKNVEYCRNQAYATEISPETRSLLNERKKLLAKVDDAVKGERFGVAARYYNRISAISEIIDGKEVARTYQKQANYYKKRAE